MRVLGILLVILLFGFELKAESAQLQSAEALYHAGIRSHQAGDLNSAQQYFMKLVQDQPDNKFALFNWGLVEYELGNKGLALAAWRRAINQAPLFFPARQALSFALQEWQGRLWLSSPSTWETFRSRVLSYFSWNSLLALVALFLALGGSLGLRFWARHQEAQELDLPRPQLSWPAGVSAIGLVLALALLGAKAYDYRQPRATLISQVVSVHSAPLPESSNLFNLNEGMEVILHQRREDWAQVTFPGSVTGWVEKIHLFQTSGRRLPAP